MTETAATITDPILQWLVDKKAGRADYAICWIPQRIIYEVLGVTLDKTGTPVSRNGKQLSQAEAEALKRLSRKVGYMTQRQLFCLRRPVDRSLTPLLREVAIAIGQAAGVTQTEATATP